MKQIFILLLSALLLLSGCASNAPASVSSAPSEIPVLTEESVQTAYESAAEAYDWFNLATMATSGDAVEQDGLEFRPVADKRFPTFDALEAYLKTLFSDELTARLLSDGQYRDIDGTLYCAEAGRGSNIYMVGKTVSAAQTDADRWTVTLTFFADSYEMERPSATIGYSQKTIDYVNQKSKWVFSSFCPGDDLDLEAETVYRFVYDDATFDTYAYPGYSDLQLALYLLHADGAYGEGPSNDLMLRFLERPQELLDLWGRLHPDWQSQIFSCIGSSAAFRLNPEELSDFSSLLTNVQPETVSQKEALSCVRAAFEEGCQRAAEDLNYQLFSLQIGDKMLHLGSQEDDFPQGYDLTEHSRENTSPSDGFGASCNVDFGTVQISYFSETENSDAYLYRITTETPGITTFLGIGVGDSEETVLSAYPDAVSLGAVGEWEVDASHALVYEPGGNAYCKHISFFIKDGLVSKIEIEDLMDGHLLSQ